MTSVCPRTNSWSHQRREFRDHRDDKARMLLWQMRTGKTKAIIDLACYLYNKGEIDTVLVLAPNGVHTNWLKRELPKHHWFGIPRRQLAWSTEESHDPFYQERMDAVNEEKDRLVWLAVNVESLHLKQVKKPIAKALKGRRFMVIADEIHLFGRPGSKWSRAAQWFFNRAAYKRGLTGTLVDNKPLQAYSQFRLLQEKGALGCDTYEEFKHHYAIWKQERLKSGRSYPAVDRYQNLEELAEHIAKWSSLVLREECDDMPSLVPSRRYISLTDRQRKAYTQLIEEYKLEAEEGEIPILDFIEGGARMIKLQQVLSGYVLDEFKDLHKLVPDSKNPRLLALAEEAAEMPKPFIVWANFKQEIRMIVPVLEKLGLKVAQYHGDVPAKQREANLQAFLDGEADTFLAQPGAGGTGLDLSIAQDMLWFSHTPNAITRKQANERATKKAGGHVGLLDFAVDDSVDTYILDDLHVTKAENADLVAGRGLRDVLDRIAL